MMLINKFLKLIMFLLVQLRRIIQNSDKLKRIVLITLVHSMNLIKTVNNKEGSIRVLQIKKISKRSSVVII